MPENRFAKYRQPASGITPLEEREPEKPNVITTPNGPMVLTPTGNAAPIPGVSPAPRVTWRTMTAEDKARLGYPQGGVYQINTDGEVRTVQEPPKPREPSKADLVSPAERTAAINGYQDASTLEALADQLEKQYKAGPGSTKGVMGVQDFLGGEANRTFDDTGNRSRGLIKRALGFTGGEINAVQESEATYGPFIPSASDWDGQIESKIQSLRDLAKTAREKSVAILGGAPDANGNITPVQPQQQGAVDYSGMSYGGNGFDQRPTPIGSDTRTVKNEEASSYIDSLVRSGLPYSAASRQFRQRFPDVPLFAPKDYNDARRHHKQNPQYQGSYGWSEKKVPMSGLERGMNAISQSVPGAAVGRYANAAVAGIPGALAGDQGTYAVDQMGQTLGAGAIAADLGGAVTGMFLGNRALKAVGADKAIRGLGEMGKNIPGLRGLGSSIAQNPGNARLVANELGYGATFGATQNPDNPLAGAAIGAGAVGAGNVLGRYTLGPALSALGHTRAGQAVGNWAAQRNGGTFQPASNLPRPERMIVSQAGPDFSQISGRLNEAAQHGLPYSLADADPRLAALAGSATRKNPDVRALAESTIRPRQLGQSERAIGFIDRHLAPSGDLGAIKKGQIEAAETASAPHYRDAYASPSIATPELNSLLNTPAGREALSRARTIAANERRDPMSLGFALDDAGNVSLRPVNMDNLQRQAAARTGLQEAQDAYRAARATPGADVKGAQQSLLAARAELRDANKVLKDAPSPETADVRPQYNTQTLDYVKRGFDDLLEPYRNEVTGQLQLDEAGRAINDVRKSMLREMDKLNKPYKQARAEYGKYASRATDAERGYKATSVKVTPETLQRVASGLPAENLPFYRQGFASSLADTAENARLTGDPYNAVYGSLGQQRKIETLFPEGAQTFGRIRSLEDDMSRTAYETIGGSPTATRQQADSLFDTGAMGTAAEVAGSMATGMPPVNALSRFGGDVWRMGLGKSAEKRAGEVGPMLLNQDPVAAEAMLQEIARRNAEFQRYRSATRRTGGMFGGGLALPFIANP